MQADNHIVLRLARDSGASSTDDRWQVLSLSDHGTFCKLDQKVRSGKCKKVTRRKQKILLTVSKSCNAVTPSNKGKGRQKMRIKKNFVNATSILNSDLEHGNRRRDAKQTGVSAADCCDFCGSSNIQKRGTVRRSSTDVIYQDSHAQKENFFEASDSGNMSRTDDLTNNVEGVGIVTEDQFETAMDSEFVLTTKDDVHKHIDGWHKGSRLNGTFALTADSLKMRRHRKVMPELETSKHRCRVKEKVSEAKDVKNEMEDCETVDVASTSESSTFNNDVIGCGVSMSRRSRPVKNRRLMDSCYVFGQMVKTRRPRKIAKKQPAADAVINPECLITDSSEIDSGKLQSINDAANDATVIRDKLHCHSPENKETLCALKTSYVSVAEYPKHDSSSLDVLCQLNDVNEDASQIDMHGNACMLKLNPDSSNSVSDTAQILLEEDCMMVTKVEENEWKVADDCKYDMHCDRAANTEVLPTESNSPLNSMADSSVNNCQLPGLSENTCHGFDDLVKTDDPLVATQAAETLEIKPFLSSGINDDSCTDGNSTTESQPTDSEVYNTSTNYSDVLTCVSELNENTASNLDSHMLSTISCNAEVNILTTATEMKCSLADTAGDIEAYTDVLNNVMDMASATVISTPVYCEVEEFVTDDTGTIESSNDVADTNDVLLPCDSMKSTKLDETFDAALASGDSVNYNICHSLFNADIITTNTDKRNVTHNLPHSIVCSRISESSLPVKTAVTSPHYRRHRVRRKTVSESGTGNDSHRNSAKSSAKLLDITVCTEEKCKEFPVVDYNLDRATDGKSRIHLPCVSNSTSAESSLTAKRTVASCRHQKNSHRSYRAHLKVGRENVAEDACHGSAERCMDSTAEERHEPVMITEDLDRLRHKSVEDDKVPEILGTSVETDTDSHLGARKHRNSCSRLIYFQHL